jgi:hypothetical protein
LIKSSIGLLFVAFLAGMFLLMQHRSHDALAQVVTINIDSKAITDFQIGNTVNKKFGSLRYSSGIVFWSENEALGGISGIRILDGGNRFLSVTDKGNWVTGSIERHNSGKIVGISSVRIAPLRDKKGNPFISEKNGDAEGLEIVGDRVLVSFERNSRILNYQLDLDKLASPGKNFRRSIRKIKLPNNSGLEAISILEPPSASGLATADIVVFSENSLDAKGNIRGFISKKNKWKEFTVQEKGGYKITDATLLPGGDIVILERQFSLISGVRIRIRKLLVAEIVPGAAIDGKTLFEADSRFQVDNLEGISAWLNDSNQTMLTIVSDNNFSPLQRNLLLEFELSNGQEDR